MSKKSEQYKNIPNPALSYISATPDIENLGSENLNVETVKDDNTSITNTNNPISHDNNELANIDMRYNATQNTVTLANNTSMQLRRKVEFTKKKPTRTQRAQLVFYPEDYKLAKRAAKLEGVSFNEWATATLAAAAQDTLEDYGQKP